MTEKQIIDKMREHVYQLNALCLDLHSSIDTNVAMRLEYLIEPNLTTQFEDKQRYFIQHIKLNVTKEVKL